MSKKEEQENSIEDFLKEEQLLKITTIYLNYSNIENFKFINKNYLNIEFLSLQNNNISNFDFIKFLPNLFYFDIRNNPISNYDPLLVKNTFVPTSNKTSNDWDNFVDLDESYKKYFIINNPNILIFNDELVLDVDRFPKKENIINSTNELKKSLTRNDSELKFSRKTTNEKIILNESSNSRLKNLFKFFSEINSNKDLKISETNKDNIELKRGSLKEKFNNKEIDNFFENEITKLIYSVDLCHSFLQLNTNFNNIFCNNLRSSLPNPINYTLCKDDVNSKKIKALYFFDLNFLMIEDINILIVINVILGLYILQIINKKLTYTLLKFIGNKYKLSIFIQNYCQNIKKMLELRLTILLGFYFKILKQIKNLNFKKRENLLNINFDKNDRIFEENEKYISNENNSISSNENENIIDKNDLILKIKVLDDIILNLDLNNIILYTKKINEIKNNILSKNKFINLEEKKKFFEENILKNIDKEFFLFEKTIFLIQYLSDFISINDFHDILLGEFLVDYKLFLEMKILFLNYQSKNTNIFQNLTDKIFTKHLQGSFENNLFFELKEKRIKEKISEFHIQLNQNTNIENIDIKFQNNKFSEIKIIKNKKPESNQQSIKKNSEINKNILMSDKKNSDFYKVKNDIINHKLNIKKFKNTNDEYTSFYDFFKNKKNFNFQKSALKPESYNNRCDFESNIKKSNFDLIGNEKKIEVKSEDSPTRNIKFISKRELNKNSRKNLNKQIDLFDNSSLMIQNGMNREISSFLKTFKMNVDIKCLNKSDINNLIMIKEDEISKNKTTLFNTQISRNNFETFKQNEIKNIYLDKNNSLNPNFYLKNNNKLMSSTNYNFFPLSLEKSDKNKNLKKYILSNQSKKFSNTWSHLHVSKENKFLQQNNIFNQVEKNKNKKIKITSIFNKREVKEPKIIKNTSLDFKFHIKKLTNRWNVKNKNFKKNQMIKSNDFEKAINLKRRDQKFMNSEDIKALFSINKKDDLLDNIYDELK